jgi:S-adenosylmethionine/arginine decarboxylase-like enzyme
MYAHSYTSPSPTVIAKTSPTSAYNHITHNMENNSIKLQREHRSSQEEKEKKKKKKTFL